MIARHSMPGKPTRRNADDMDDIWPVAREREAATTMSALRTARRPFADLVAGPTTTGKDGGGSDNVALQRTSGGTCGQEKCQGRGHLPPLLSLGDAALGRQTGRQLFNSWSLLM